MVRRGCVVLVLLGLVMAGCTKGSSAATRTVLVDNKAKSFNGAFLAYYPNTLQVHAGDTIDFKEIWTGEPHSVTMGKLVDAGLAAQAKVKGDQPAPAFAKLPSMFPNGPGDLNQDGAQPCFMTSGVPSSKTHAACPKVTQPAFDGTQAYYSSGFLKKDSTFAVKLSDTISTGTYRYYCNVHGPDMSGSITVVPKATKTPSDADVTAAGRQQFKKVTDKLDPAAAAARAGHKFVPYNVAGYGDPAVQSAGINEFFPPTINAKVGEKVTWAILGFHTISFGVTPDLSLFTFAPDGSVHINEKAAGPAGGPMPQAGSGAPNAKISVKVTDGGTYNGTGFKSTGGTDSFPPNLAGYSVTFTKAGTYPFACVVHPGMGGVVQVT